ncbi:MAG: NrfD/PsrC family molybdoenzyme membrane anchor subunit [Candidatus Binatia bacterium]
MKVDRERIESDLLRSVEHTSSRFYFALLGIIIVIAWGSYAYFTQVVYGLGVTGMQQPVTWGFYIVNFVFFIGISHAGTLISAILRLSKAEWRRPITRMAEVITGIVLAIGGLHPIIDLGRPDRILHIFYNGRLQSPLLWDVTAITAYFAASTVYLYIPMIPDIARIRDRGVRPRWLYRLLSWGWVGTAEQKRVLEKAINILMIMVIPIAVSVHTVISFIFAMTLQPGWHSTIFGPYFVVGAIYSGIAALFLVMIVFRRVYHLENYLKEIHLQQLSRLLLIMAIIWFYFTFAEYLTGVYGAEPTEMKILLYKFTGRYAIPFWLMIFVNFLLPVVVLSTKRLCTTTGICVVSIGVTLGMWLERLNIVVPTLENPALSFPPHFYIPSWVEWGMFAWGVGVFCLGFALFAKFFPLISIWEIEEGMEESREEVDERMLSYQPEIGDAAVAPR